MIHAKCHWKRPGALIQKRKPKMPDQPAATSEADADIAAGRVKSFDSMDELIEGLDAPPPAACRICDGKGYVESDSSLNVRRRPCPECGKFQPSKSPAACELPTGPETLAAFIKQAIAESEILNADVPRPIAGVHFSKEGKSLDVTLDNSLSTYGDWIEGEGADISITRDQETHKVAGAHFPLYAKTLVIGGSNIETLRFDLETGSMFVIRDGHWSLANLPAQPKD